MPYKIEKESKGFFVVDAAGKRFSKKPLSKEKAMKQRISIALSEQRNNPGVNINYLFA